MTDHNNFGMNGVGFLSPSSTHIYRNYTAEQPQIPTFLALTKLENMQMLAVTLIFSHYDYSCLHPIFFLADI